MSQNSILDVAHLYVSYGDVNIVRDVSFSLRGGEFLGIVGESGSGKTTMLRALMALRRPGNTFQGSIRFLGRDLTRMGPEELRKLRGGEIAMIPQDASAAMDGTNTISALFHETIQVHSGPISRKESDRRASELMRSLLLEDTDRILKSYPFELSGGMCQRVMIAAALINSPQLILGDEPTSALDVTSQLQVVNQLKLLKQVSEASMVMISHNFGVIAAISDTIAVMYGGRIVEYGKRDEVLFHPCHPYTKALIAAVPDRDGHISGGLPGTPPIFEKEMKGCPFADRCAFCQRRCREELPADRWITGTHRTQCFRDTEDQ